MASGRLERWRPQPRRRALVVLIIFGWFVYVGTNAIDQPLGALVGLVVMWGAWFVLRSATRSVADLPDADLDERQLGVRDRSYLSAYRLVGAAVALFGIATIVGDALRVDAVSADLVQAAAFGLLFLMMVLPSCVVGWNEREA